MIKRSNIEKEEGPGPGSYNDMEAVKNLEAKKQASHKHNTAAFISKTKRVEQKKKKEVGPSIGAYNP